MNVIIYQLKEIEDRIKHIEKVLSVLLEIIGEDSKIQQIEQYIEDNLYYIDTETYEKKYYNSGKDIKGIIEGGENAIQKRSNRKQ